jgi:outer membrane protein assembly factor BamD (BamD/ComL family)
MYIRYLLLAFSTIILSYNNLNAGWIVREGKIFDADEVTTLPLEEHFARGATAYNDCQWDEAIAHFRAIISSYPNSNYAKEAYFFYGIALFNVDENEFANEAFTNYIKNQTNPTYFEEAITYKFAIAERFKEGARRHILGYRRLPKWLNAHNLALSTYDEIAATLPCHEIAAKALFSKGNLLWSMENYSESIEAFQTLIRRFPKHELAPVCYITINDVYLDQCQREFQNPDLLALAQLNLRKFKHDFPRDERLEQAENKVMAIKEVYAQGLFETGQFYERVKQPEASKIYYKNALRLFPDTQVAKECSQRLSVLGNELQAATE